MDPPAAQQLHLCSSTAEGRQLLEVMKRWGRALIGGGEVWVWSCRVWFVQVDFFRLILWSFWERCVWDLLQSRFCGHFFSVYFLLKIIIWTQKQWRRDSDVLKKKIFFLILKISSVLSWKTTTGGFYFFVILIKKCAEKNLEKYICIYIYITVTNYREPLNCPPPHPSSPLLPCSHAVLRRLL